VWLLNSKNKCSKKTIKPLRAGSVHDGPGIQHQNQEERFIFAVYQESGMIRIIRDNLLVFVLYAILLISGLLLVAAVPRLELHLLLNSGHTKLLDSFFRLLTFLGDGWFAVIFSILFLFIQFRYFFMLILSFCVSGLMAQFLKRVVFPDILRPSAYLDQMPGLELVPGIDLHHTLAFPSGHTTTAFAVLLLTGFIINKKYTLFGLMLLAWLAGISRVYLSQHFLIDVLGGSLLGLFSALFFYWYFRKFKSAWMDRSLTGIIRRNTYK
jgi:membrane-associated phospholipid phosphatase